LNCFFKSNIESMYQHFNSLKNEKEIGDILSFNTDNPFWITAKEQLSENDYQKLKGEIIGKQRKSDVRRKRRNI